MITGPNIGKSGIATTNINGQASFTYDDTSAAPWPQRDTMQASIGVNGSNMVEKWWYLRCDANSSNSVEAADIAIIRAANGQSATGPHDPWDGNADGRIRSPTSVTARRVTRRLRKGNGSRSAHAAGRGICRRNDADRSPRQGRVSGPGSERSREFPGLSNRIADRRADRFLLSIGVKCPEWQNRKTDPSMIAGEKNEELLRKRARRAGSDGRRSMGTSAEAATVTLNPSAQFANVGDTVFVDIVVGLRRD